MEIAQEYKISVKPSQWEQAKEAAANAHISLREWIRQAITEKLGKGTE